MLVVVRDDGHAQKLPFVKHELGRSDPRNRDIRGEQRLWRANVATGDALAAAVYPVDQPDRPRAGASYRDGPPLAVPARWFAARRPPALPLSRGGVSWGAASWAEVSWADVS